MNSDETGTVRTWKITYTPRPETEDGYTTQVSETEQILADGFDSYDGMCRFYRYVSTKGDKVLAYEGQTQKRQYFFFCPYQSVKKIEVI